MDKVQINAPIYALLSVCDLRAINAAADNAGVLAGVKSNPEARDLMRRLYGEAQAAYIKARDAGARLAFCRDFVAANSQYAKARVTAVTGGYLSGVNARVRAAIGHDVCKQGDAVKLSKADREEATRPCSGSFESSKRSPGKTLERKVGMSPRKWRRSRSSSVWR